MPTMTDAPAHTATRRRRLTTTDLALIAAFAALTAVASYTAAIPVGGAGVPITLQTLAVLLCGLVLGPVRGFLAVCLYLVLGLIGLPVFSEHTSGAGAFNSSSAGYLYTFPLAALVAGLLVAYVPRGLRTRALVPFAAAVVATVINHLGGVVGMHQVLHVDWHQAFAFDAPFWAGDLVKAAVAAIVAAEVHRAFPGLLGRARRG
jgi:biotin transport system substrate-specific component